MKHTRCCLLTILFMAVSGPVLAQTNTLPVGLTGVASNMLGATIRDAPLAKTAIFDNTGNAPEEEYYDVQLYLEIRYVTMGTNAYYILYPQIYTTPPTYCEVSSPNGLSYGYGEVPNSYHYATFQALTNEIAGGDWSLTLDADGTYYDYTFTVDASALSINDLPPTVILNPLHGSTGVATNTTFQWTGPTDFANLYVYNHDDEANKKVFGSYLPVAQTNWTYGGTLPVGTNTFDITYFSYNSAGLSVSALIGDFSPIGSWQPGTGLISQGTSTFVTTAGFVPLPVTLLSSTLNNNSFDLSFVSQAGATHTVQCTTNLVVGPWLPITNFTGTGGLELITLPNTNSAAFYRVKTQ